MTATDESDGRRINVVQGEYSVSADPSVVFTTILGSCVAACIRDPVVAVGGINHFLLPGNEEGGRSAEAEHYGVHLMELLVNGLMKQGARRDRLEAKLMLEAREDQAADAVRDARQPVDLRTALEDLQHL